MKKFLALVLALTLVLGLATVVGAATDTPKTDKYTNRTNPTSDEKPFDSNTGATSTGIVTINVQPNQPSPLYYVVVAWDELEFTYSFGNDAPVWNPLDHSYTPNTDAGWTNDTANITVTNHSNAAVNISAGFDGQGSMTTNGVKVELTNAQFDLARADEGISLGDFNAAPRNIIKVSVDTTTKPTTNNTFDLGTITVSITPAP